MRHAISLSLLLLLPGLARANDTHCDDVTAWHDWDARIARHPDDTALHTLHALWMGLCAKVTRKELTTEQADEVFEYVRRTFLEQRHESHTKNADKPHL